MKRITTICSGNLPLALALAVLTAAMPPAGASAPAPDPAEPPVTPKPTPPITIKHRLTSEPQVGQPVEVILTVGAEGEMAGVSLNLSAGDPLAMIDPVGSLGLGTLRAGEPADIAVTVLPLVDRTQYLSVTVTALIDGTPQTRSIAVPIRLPGSAVRKSDDETAGKPGERVRSFRAIETVR